MGQKGPKWSNLSICPLLQHFSQDWLMSWFFMYFGWKGWTISTQNWRSWIFWENSQFLETGPKGPKLSNLSIFLLLQHFSQDWLISFIQYFAWSWEIISTQNWRSRIFFENSCLPENGPKRTKMVCFCPFAR